MITWGLTGRGNDRRATVFCMKCREVMKRDVPVNEAREEEEKYAATHSCKR